MAFTSVLKPENSIIAGLTTAALVYGIYAMTVGPVSVVHASAQNDNNIAASLKKAGWISVVTVGGISLIARDPNIAILGSGVIVAEELAYRHANLASAATGMIDVSPNAYRDQGPSFQAAAQATADY